MHPLDINVFQVVTIPIAQPNVATDFVFTVPANTRLDITQLKFTFSADVNVASRLIALEVDDGTTENPAFMSPRSQTDSLTWTYAFSQGIQTLDATANLFFIANPIPTPMILNQGDTLQSSIISMQAGDQISNISIRVKRWITEG